MSTTMSDHQLAARVARELSSPEPGMHFGLTLLVGTLVASPVLASAALGRHAVPTALGIYAATLVVVWLLAGLIGGALALSGRGPTASRTEASEGSTPESDETGGPIGSGGSPPSGADSIGSDSAH